MKRCYTCKLKLPLWMFVRAVRFTIATDQGRNRVCRICTFRTKGKVVRWREGKFQLVTLTLWERIKELVKR